MNEKGEIQPENWVEGIANLNANNMSSYNAIVAGGVVYSGAVGDNPTVQANALNSINMGSKIQNEQGTRSMANMFNLAKDTKDKLAVKENGDIDYENSSPEAISEFGSYVEKSGLAEATKRDILGNVVAKTSEATGASTDTVWAGMSAVAGYGLQKVFGDPVGKTGKALWKTGKKLNPLSREESTQEPTNETKNSGGDYQDGDGKQSTGKQNIPNNLTT